MVDGEIVNIVRMRLKECIVYEAPDHKEKCKHLLDDFDTVAQNYFIKCSYFIYTKFQLLVFNKQV